MTMAMTMNILLATGIITPSIATSISSNCFWMDCGPLAMAYPMKYLVSNVMVRGQDRWVNGNFIRPEHTPCVQRSMVFLKRVWSHPYVVLSSCLYRCVNDFHIK